MCAEARRALLMLVKAGTLHAVALGLIIVLEEVELVLLGSHPSCRLLLRKGMSAGGIVHAPALAWAGMRPTELPATPTCSPSIVYMMAH